MSPPKYPHTPHWPWSLSKHRDDSVHPNPSHFLNKWCVITEKLDGGNTKLFNGEVYARSVATPATQGWFDMVKKYHGYKSKYYKDYVFCGEDIYGVHSIKYNPVRPEETFYLFGVLDLYDNTWLSWTEIEDIANEMDIKTVPVIQYGQYDSVDQITYYFEELMKYGSKLGPTKEGMTMRICHAFREDTNTFMNMCKYVRENHVQTDEHWTKNWQSCELIK
jgi:ATP-dependent RNA circularization protein (DNA/RNA ligase family)